MPPGWHGYPPHRRLTLAASLTIATLAVGGCFLLPKEEHALAPPLVEPPPIVYRTAAVEVDLIEVNVVVRGTFIYPSQTALQFGDRAGRLAEFGVRLGDTVEAGQILARLDTDGLELDVARQRLRLRRAELALERLEAAGADRFQLQIAGVDVQLEQLQLEELLLELEKATLRSPIRGEVMYLTRSNPGEQVGARETIAQVADPRDLSLAYRGPRVAQFSIGATVDVRFEQADYFGEVIMTPGSIPRDADERLRDLVLIRVDAPAGAMRAGQSARIILSVDRREDAVVVPADAVHHYLERRFVYVLEDGLRAERTVEVGLTTATKVEVIDGLSPGEEVVLR